MLELSIKSLQIQPQDQLIIISRLEDNLPERFKNFQQAEWIEISGNTRGQLDTFLRASGKIKFEDIVIYNCDTYFEASNLRAEIESGKYDGIIPCSAQPGESWSFCEVTNNHLITRVTEKERISDWASVGYYYFKDKKQLLDLAQKEVERVKEKESYVAPLYNEYIRMQLPLKMVVTDSFLPFGTVEQLKDYWGVELEDLIRQNS